MLIELGHSANFMPKRHSDTLSTRITKIGFEGVSISNMSIIVDMITKFAINSNSGELQAMPPVKNYTGR